MKREAAYIVGVTRTQSADAHVQFWRPDRAGYTTRVAEAGRYPATVCTGSLHDGSGAIAVHCAPVERMAVDGRVPNTAVAWAVLCASVLTDPPKAVRPPVLRGLDPLRARALGFVAGDSEVHLDVDVSPDVAEWLDELGLRVGVSRGEVASRLAAGAAMEVASGMGYPATSALLGLLSRPDGEAQT